jgi:flavin-dependent dehydrogenase
MVIDDSIDVAVIGGGPAGLSAAARLAGNGARVRLFERLPRPGLLSHPCGSMVGPVRGHITLEGRDGGVLFREAGYLFTHDMILGYPRVMRFTGPSGRSFGMTASLRPGTVTAFQVDKGRLIESLARDARAAGADLCYGENVSGLVVEGGVVRGVRVAGKEVRSRVVISAEGLSRRFSREAGLYPGEPRSHVYVSALYLRGLQLAADDLGQHSYLGQAYTGIPGAIGVFHSLGADRAMVLLSANAPGLKWPHPGPIGRYLRGFIGRVPGIRKAYESGEVYAEKGCTIVIDSPSALVASGFIGAGDTVAPLGHSSNSIAMLMGQEAAGLALKALETGDVSAGALSSYNRWLRSKLFAGVQFEGKLIMALMAMDDREVDALCDAFEGVDLEPFFLGSPLEMTAATLKLMARPAVIRNWAVVRKIF